MMSKILPLTTKGMRSLTILFLAIITGAAQAAYQPPVGIPAPPFGINEQISDFYQRPTPWDQETPGWYYVDQYHPNSSNKNTYGTPDAPRRTIPNPIPAGSVVEIHGRYDFAPVGYDTINAAGRPDAPVFITGGTGTSSGPALVLRKWKILSSYTIIENIEFTNRGKIDISYPSHHVALRNNEIHDMAGKIGGGGRSNDERLNHVVIYRNKIHSEEGWNVDPNNDKDNHGIKFGPYTEDIWILENTGYHNGGDFLQIGDWGDGTPATMNRTRRYYIGRNTVYANRQSPVGIKQSTDIIISENHFYNTYKIQRNVGGQSGIYFIYGPENVWIINNRIHDANGGISGGSNSGGQGKNIYIIGNLFYNIKGAPETEYKVNSAWSMGAIRLAGGINRYIINNTMINVDAGINIPSSGPIYIANNIIGNITKGHHIFIEPREAADRTEILNNLLFQENGLVKVRFAGNIVNTTEMLELNYTASGNMIQDPLLDPNTLAPDASSPAVDRGTTTGFVRTVFQRFQDLYGIDLQKDLYGTPRPKGNGWDIGAVESGTNTSIPIPSAPTNVRATVITQ